MRVVNRMGYLVGPRKIEVKMGGCTGEEWGEVEGVQGDDLMYRMCVRGERTW